MVSRRMGWGRSKCFRGLLYLFLSPVYWFVGVLLVRLCPGAVGVHPSATRGLPWFGPRLGRCRALLSGEEKCGLCGASSVLSLLGRTDPPIDVAADLGQCPADITAFSLSSTHAYLNDALPISACSFSNFSIVRLSMPPHL